MSQHAKERIPSLVSESRLAQNLSERVTDPAVLSAVALLLRTATERRETEGEPVSAGAAAAS